jgi:hypothetical protein
MFVQHEIHGLKSVLEVHSQYMQSLPTRDWYGTKSSSKDSDSGLDYESKSSTRSTPWPEADALKTVTTGVTELQVKIQSELRYAKLEAAWGKLSAKDISTITRLLKDVLVPILGMESLTEVTDRIEKRGGWGSVKIPKADHDLTEAELIALEEKEKEQWKWIFEQLRDPVHRLQQAMAEGLDHSLYTLEFAKRPASHAKTDLEANGPGTLFVKKGFAPYLENMIQEFLGKREGFLKEWCSFKGVKYPPDENGVNISDSPLHERHQSQLYLILDVSYKFQGKRRC